jgi:hypothetical protein
VQRELTNKEKASLNSETCSSVRESACQEVSADKGQSVCWIKGWMIDACATLGMRGNDWRGIRRTIV